MQKETLVIIPARIGSTRLTEKPLRKIGKFTMIERVALQALESGLENIYVATDHITIAETLKVHNIPTIMTDAACASGTDRVYQAWQNLPNKDDFRYIINVQGDMPFIDPKIIRKVAENLWTKDYDIITPITKVSLDQALLHSNVKVVIDNRGRALYFSRSIIPHSAKDFLYHIGVYGYKAPSLEKFVQLPIAQLEIDEQLEQLRALVNGMSIGICYADSAPISVDTQEDYDKAINYL